MSFRDDVNAVVKTPEQVIDERRKQSIDSGMSCAKKDYENVKDEIKRKSQCGDYKTVGNKRIIKFDYNHCSVYNFVWMKSEWFDGIIDKGIQCELKDAVALDAYKEELKRLAEEDEIEIHLLYVFRDDNGSEYSFDIPGNYSSVHMRNTCHVHRRSEYVLRCSFTF